MNFLTFISLWILLLCLISQIYSIGIGKVFIGFMENSSLIDNTSIPWQPTILSSSYNFPVFVKVFDDDNASYPLPLAVNVSIECETNRNGRGFSMVSFSPLTLYEGFPEGVITVSFIKSSRPVEIRCFGNTIFFNASETCNCTQLFTKETSISETRSVIVLPKLTVSICNSTIAVPEATKSFLVKFSVVAKNFPVDVSCNPVDAAVTELVIPDVNVNISSDFAKINYFLPNGTLTSPVKVSCLAKYTRANQSITTPPGNPGWFVPNEVNVDLIPSSLQVKSLTFQAFLTPRGLSGQDIHIQCYSRTVHSQEEATAFIDSISCLKKNTTINSVNQTTTPGTSPTTTANPPTTTQTTTPAINLTNQWRVKNPNITLKAEGATLQLERRLPVQKSTLELVVVTCCASISTGDQVLRGRKLTLTATASLQPFVAYNQSGLTFDVIPVGNPAKKSFANCPCDMTWNNCDVNCCCDMDCSPSDVETFAKCIPGFQGGQPPPPPAWMCDTPSSDICPKTFLCVLSQDSAFLGYYQHDKSALNSIKFKTEWNPKSSFSKADSSKPANDQVFNRIHGSQIHTALPNTVNSAPKVLTLPQRTFSGQCATAAPVRFLTNLNSDCVYQLTPDLCSDNSILSATSFVLSTALQNPSCPTAYAIRHELDLKFVDTDVNYYCTSNPKPYLKSLDMLSDVLASRLDSSQNFTIPNACVTDGSGLYRCPDNVDESFSARAEELTPRCSWDDGFTRPGTPTLGPNGLRCDNVVLSIRYQFTWSGNRIEFLNASVILGNVSLFNVKEQQTVVYYSESVTDPVTNVTNIVSRSLIRNTTLNESTQLSPHYEVRYRHNFNNSEGDKNDGLPRERSGEPGYDFGKPILSGTAVLNDTNAELLYINQNASQQMSVWEPAPSGLCSLAGKRKITFGGDLFSSCVVPLRLDSLTDCENLRKWIFYQLSLLMPSDRIGRYGDNHPGQSSDWIHVLRENILGGSPEIVPEFNATNVTTEKSSTSSGTTLPLTTQPTLTNNQSNTSNGTCVQVPAGIVLNIMYAHTGLAHGTIIKEIIGARVRYVLDNWTFTCAGNVIGGSCVSPPGNINDTDPESLERYQLFTLTSVVQFTRVPAAKPKPVIRYYELPSSDRCWFDHCFEEMFNPILRQPGEEAVSYINKFAVTLIIVFIALAYGIIFNNL